METIATVIVGILIGIFCTVFIIFFFCLCYLHPGYIEDTQVPDNRR
jgi:hypothetical protein